MQRLDFNLSASTINSFVSCPWAFQQDKIRKRVVIDIPSPAVILGQAFHKLLESFYNQRTWVTYDLFQNWERFFNIEVKQQKANGLFDLKFIKSSGFTVIKNWVKMAKDNHWLHDAYTFSDGTKGIEWEFMLPFANDKYEINVHGFMDLIIEVNGKIYILDWKSGKHHKDKYTLQAIIYSWALYKQHGIIEDCVRFIHPAKKYNEIVDVKVKDEDYLIVKQKVDEIFTAISNDKFERRPGDGCKWCKFVDCPHNINDKLKLYIKKMECE